MPHHHALPRFYAPILPSHPDASTVRHRRPHPAQGPTPFRVRARGPFILVGSLVALTGYAILFATSQPWVGYAGTILAACGLFPSIACVLAWAGGNSGGEVKRAVAIGIVIGCGNLGP